jgi:1-acyl-sn-glycerol-3-phosphate acyltransferase
VSDSTWEKSRLLRWINGGDTAWGTNPGDYDAELVRRTLARAGRLFRAGGYFPVEAHGMENIPPAPAMIVSNHSGGTTIPDVWGFMFAWYSHFGFERPIHPLAHEIILSTRLTGRYFSRRGVLRAHRSLAHGVLSEWRRDLMVMPGGDLDTWRPYSKRYEVQFGGRTGYARTALKACVPIVPIANAGAHETLIVLTDGQRIARALRLPELVRASIFPIHLSLPWGLAIGPWPHLPTPARLRYRIGKAIEPPSGWKAGDDPPDELVVDHDRKVQAAVQQLLNELKQSA